MNWYSVLLAAASGGLAALIASLIFGKEASKKTAFTIATVVLFVVFNTLSKQFILPEINSYVFNKEVEETFSEIPVYQTIKKNDPALYEEITSSLKESYKAGLTQQQLIDLVRSKISKLAIARMPHASTDALLNYVQVMTEEMEILHRENNGMCYKFLFPQVSGGVDATKVFPIEIQQKDLKALNEIILSSKEKIDIPNESDVMLLLEPVYLNLFSVYGESVAIIEQPTQPNIDQNMVCEITLKLYQDILALPEDKAAMVLRWMFGQV